MIDICAVCENELHEPFPDDFPDKFKFCCTCHQILSFLLGMDTEFFKREKFSEHLENCSICQGVLKMKEEMMRLITVN